MAYRIALLIAFILQAALAFAQRPCEASFTLTADKPDSRKHNWVMHRPLPLTNFNKDSITVEMRLHKMRDASNNWTIRMVFIDKFKKCVQEGDQMMLRFSDWTEVFYDNTGGTNCEGVYQTDLPVSSIRTPVSGNRLKGLLRKKRLALVVLYHGYGHTEGFLSPEQGESLSEMIDCMLSE